MKLTPLDIRHREFKRGMRGYADVEVDEFLDEVADEYERLFKENIDLQERVEALEDKVTAYKRIEDTLQKTLVNAQASAEEQKQNATKQAQLILQDAELKSRQLVNDAYSERQTIEQNLAKLRNSEDEFRFKFKTLLESYLRQLKETSETKADVPDHSADFARHTEAIKEAIARESVPAEPKSPAPAPEVAAEARPEPTKKPEAPVPEVAAEARPEPTKKPEAPVPEVAAEAPPEPIEKRAAPAVPRAEPDAAAVKPARGPGGVQAGVAPHRAGPADADEAPETRADEPEDEATHGADDKGAERVVFGESDDILSDVDTGVNENEFKW